MITYDRRGFGASSQPWDGYDYDTLSADLSALLESLDLTDVTLVGFSMGGGEVARYLSRFGTARISKVVFAAAIPPYLYKSDDNPDGGLDDDTIAGFEDAVRTDRLAFLDEFTAGFFAAGGKNERGQRQAHPRGDRRQRAGARRRRPARPERDPPRGVQHRTARLPRPLRRDGADRIGRS